MLSVCFMFHFLSIAGLAPRGLDCPGPFGSLWSGVAELSVPPPWWLGDPPPPRNSVRNINVLVTSGCWDLAQTPLTSSADVPSAAPAIIIKEVNSSICSEPLTPPTQPQPPNPVPHSCIPAQTRTRIHPRLSTSVVVGAGRRHISEWGASELEQKKHHWSPDPDQLLPTTLHLLHRCCSGPVQAAHILSISHTRIRARTHAPRASCECSSAPSPALPSQHAAPGGGGSSHGGPAQR